MKIGVHTDAFNSAYWSFDKCLAWAQQNRVQAQAKSKVDGKYYPMAFVTNYGKGRTFHCTLGYDAQALRFQGCKVCFSAAAPGRQGWSLCPTDSSLKFVGILIRSP